MLPACRLLPPAIRSQPGATINLCGSKRCVAREFGWNNAETEAALKNYGEEIDRTLPAV
jgi:hypothetical protein